MTKYLGDRVENFCSGCPLAESLGESPAGVYGAAILPWGEVDILAVVNPSNGEIFRTEIESGIVTQDNLQEALDDCEGPVTIERRILPDKLVCGAISALLDSKKEAAA